jgi:hypothetical protein
MREPLRRATLLELEASGLGAGMLGFGLGARLAHSVESYAPWILLAGRIIHGWGMYSIHQRNKLGL